jgi:hypothetical protein
LNDEQKQLELELKFSWDWFQYHASQRLTAFNFFLVLIGAIAVGYAQAVTHASQTLGIVLGSFGAFVALAFLAMDIRNQELVECGLKALKDLEAQLDHLSIVKEDCDREQLHSVMPWPFRGLFPSSGGRPLDGRRKWRYGWFSHRRLLRLVLLVACLLSLGGTGWAVAGFPDTSPTHMKDAHHARGWPDRGFPPPPARLRE